MIFILKRMWKPESFSKLSLTSCKVIVTNNQYYTIERSSQKRVGVVCVRHRAREHGRNQEIDVREVSGTIGEERDGINDG